MTTPLIRSLEIAQEEKGPYARRFRAVGVMVSFRPRNFHMTRQHPQPVSFFLSPPSFPPFSPSLLAILSRSNGSIALCPGLISVMFPNTGPGLAPCLTRGMGLYPACWKASATGAGLALRPPPPPAGGWGLRGRGCMRGHSEGDDCSCRDFSSASREEGWRPLTVCSASGENSRGSWAGGFSWLCLRCWASSSRIRCCESFCARSHCSCCSRFACVGRSCSSGGSRGSGLYIVASQGASPSGRFIAVAGRGSRPERDLGLWMVDDGVRGEGVAVDTIRGF